MSNSSPRPATVVDGPVADESTERQDFDLVRRLRSGDQETFAALVRDWSPAMLRLARSFVATAQSAEDVVQDTWIAVLNGLDNFQGRSSLRTWTFTILVNRAKSRGVKDARSPAIGLGGRDDEGPTVDPARFRPDGDRYPGHWTTAGAPAEWTTQPERRVIAMEIFEQLEEALRTLPQRQRVVITMRDIAGFSADETCAALNVSQNNQRVLLHRARAAMRTALEQYYHA